MLATIPVEEGCGVLCIQSEEGDTRIQWKKTDQNQVNKARARFDELKVLGYLPYSVSAKGDQGKQMTQFDPDAERIIMALPMIGG